VRQASGFTLIELLITTTLLSILIFLGATALGLFAKKWDGQLGDFDLRMQQTKNSLLVREVLESLIPYVAYDQSESPAIYFEGNRNGFVGVSSKSIYKPNYFSVVRFSLVQDPDLTYRIMYEEWPMVDDVLRDTKQTLVFSDPLVLFEAVENPKFDYFGWPSMSAKLTPDDLIIRSLPSWLPNYNSLAIGLPPIRARLRFTIDNQSYQISALLAVDKPGLLAGYSGSYMRVRRQGEGADSDTSGDSSQDSRPDRWSDNF